MSLSRIDTNSISAGAIGSADIAANAITSAQISANAITSAQISANAITTVQIAANAITASQIAPGSIPPGVPTGAILDFDGDPGEGWLECNGQIVSQVTYSDLYSKVGLIVDGLTSNTPFLLNPNNSASYYFYDVAYGNSTYVASMDGQEKNVYERTATSTDAVTWTVRSNGWVSGTGGMTSIIYTDKFVAAFGTTGTAATNRNCYYTSTDGITWTARTGPAGGNFSIRNIAYGNSTYVASSSGTGVNCIQTSTDGITWTLRTTPISISGSNWVSYGGGVFVQSCYVGYYTVIQTSTDGITWTYRSAAFVGNTPVSTVYDGEKFWLTQSTEAAGQQRVYYTSTDGITWIHNTATSTLLPQMGNGLSYDSTNDILFGSLSLYSVVSAGEQRGNLAFSRDKGVTWQISSNPSGFYEPTATTGQSGMLPRAPIPGYIRPTGSANGKLFYAGYIQGHNSSSGGLNNHGYLNIANPYTYQTDTQFAVPSAASFQVAGGAANGKISRNIVPNAYGTLKKLYIKT